MSLAPNLTTVPMVVFGPQEMEAICDVSDGRIRANGVVEGKDKLVLLNGDMLGVAPQ